MDEENQSFITPEFIEKMKSQDARLRHIDVMIQIERELESSLALKLVLEKSAEDAAAALERLADADPTNYNLIRQLQAEVYRARFIARTINKARYIGAAAEASLSEEAIIEMPDSTQE